jgi:transcriptional regulator with XRE-family HTH domain
LAKKLGTSQATISNIETMDANPSFKQLNKIAKALGSELFLSFR